MRRPTSPLPRRRSGEKRATGFLSMLAERFRDQRRLARRRTPSSSCPSPSLEQPRSPSYGFALADRHRRASRPHSALVVPPFQFVDVAAHRIHGSARRRTKAARLLRPRWQLLAPRPMDSTSTGKLLDVASQSLRSGGAIRVTSLDLIAVQTEISNEVFAALHGLSAGDQIDSPRTPCVPYKMSSSPAH